MRQHAKGYNGVVTTLYEAKMLKKNNYIYIYIYMMAADKQLMIICNLFELKYDDHEVSMASILRSQH